MLVISTYLNKLSHGIEPNDDEWTDYLLEIHSNTPGLTSSDWSRHCTAEGFNSYQVLAQTISQWATPPLSVMDLACGDGHLLSYLTPLLNKQARILGVDMSLPELAMAKAQHLDPHVFFTCTKAHRLPVKNGSIDWIASHLSLMLMRPIEPVIQEIARVLSKHGIFTAVIHNSADAEGLWKKIQDLIFISISQAYSKIKKIYLGDERTLSIEGLNTLFTSTLGFSPINELKKIILILRVTPSEMWKIIKNLYFVNMLQANKKIILKEKIETLLSGYTDITGRLSVDVPFRIFSAKKI